MPQLLPALVLAGAAALIFVSSELFVNAVEWLGSQLGVGRGAVGTVLAAAGTSVPENLITIVALVFTGGEAGKAVGVGAILGAPLVLATFAFATVGITALGAHRRRARGRSVALDTEKVRSDLLWFLGVFGVAVSASALPPERPLRLLVAAGLILAWLLYAVRSLRWAEESDARLRPLHFHRTAAIPHPWRVVAQMVIAVAGMGLGAHFFVDALLHVSTGLGITTTLAALLLAPVATELPEVFNTVLWVRRGEETLAVGNLSGSMLLQSALPCALGLALTHWTLTGPAFWSALFTILAVLWLRWRLVAGGHGWQPWELIAALGFYGAFLYTATVSR